MSVRLLKVSPQAHTVVAVLRPALSDRLMAQLIGTSKLRAFTLGVVDDYPLGYVQRDWDAGFAAGLPRWHIEGCATVTGPAIVFGRNEAGKAATCPLTSDDFRAKIEWLLPISEIAAVLAPK